MDPFHAFRSAFFKPPPAAPTRNPLSASVLDAIALSDGKTPAEQLAAFAFAWGSEQAEAPKAYREAFEHAKSTFFGACGNAGSLEKSMIFNKHVRTGIRSQLPSGMSAELEKAYAVCEEKLDQGKSGYTYANMKADMLAAIRELMRDAAGSRPRLRQAAESHSQHPGLHVNPPSSAASASMPAFQPALNVPSVPYASSAPPGNNPVVVTPFADSQPMESKMPFLDVFPDEWRARPEWKKVIAGMQVYLSCFAPFRGPAQAALLEADPKALRLALETFHWYTSLPDDEACRVVYERDVVNNAMQKSFNRITNAKMLGCSGSRMMESDLARKPGKQLSLSMRTPVLTSDGRTCRPIILSVSAPALDTPEQPEWNEYVKDAQLDQAAYRTAFQTLSSHIRQCVDHPGHEGAQVVLSGFGLANFLAALPSGQKDVALRIGAEVFVTLIKDLRARNVDVVYTDYTGDAPPWPQVNRALGSEKVRCVGSVPGAWIKDQQIIVNAWDPHALVGNGCAKDNSLDGYIGRNALVHETHAVACLLNAYGYRR